MKTLLAIILCVSALGCARKPKTIVQRFVPISSDGFAIEGVPWHGYFALDTETGSLCRTVSLEHFPKGSADDLAHSILSCSDILGAEKEAAKH